MLSHDRMSIGAAKWSDGKFRANKKKTLCRAGSLLLGISDMEGQGIKYWCWIYTRADCFYGQGNIYWYVRIKLIKSWASWWGSKDFLPELGKDPSLTFVGLTATQSLTFLSFLEVIERAGYIWWTHEFIRKTHHYSAVVVWVHDQRLFKVFNKPLQVRI